MLDFREKRVVILNLEMSEAETTRITRHFSYSL